MSALPKTRECLHLHSVDACDMDGSYSLCLNCGTGFIFPPKPFVASVQGDQYVKGDDASFEMFKKTGQLKYLRKVTSFSKRRTA